MITFEGRQQTVKTADLIGRKAHGAYPHISSSMLKYRLNKSHKDIDFILHSRPEYYNKISQTISAMRYGLKNANAYYANLIYEMQDKHVGNCFEEAMLAKLIAKINGQKNIYIGKILIEKENVENKKDIDHTVAFITNKKIKAKQEYTFKDKEALIIDPWLGIADFAGNYFTKLKNQFAKMFREIPNQDFLLYLIGTDSRNIREFRDGRNNSCQKISFSIISGKNDGLDNKKIKLYKSFFPELVIKKYKKMKLPKASDTK